MFEMKNFNLLIISLFATVALWSQQETQFTQYYQNAYFFNPAAGGTKSLMEFDAGFRRQWLGIEGSPRSVFLTGHSVVKFESGGSDVVNEFNTKNESFYQTPKNTIGRNKHVVGGRLLNDAIGPFEKNSVMASYAYHLRFSKNTMLGLGMSAGWSNYGINSDKVKLVDNDDEAYEDFLLRNNNQNIFDVNAGISLYGERFHFGISSIQLLDNDMIIDQVQTVSTYGRHWFMFGKYNFDIIDKFAVEPHFMGQLIGQAPFAINFGSRFIYDKKYWLNTSYRWGDAVNFGFGLNFLENLRVGYAFDFGIGVLQGTAGNAHEIQLGYVIGNNRNIDKEIDEGENP